MGPTDDGVADSPQTEVVTTVDPFSPITSPSPSYSPTIENDIPDCTTQTVYEWGVVEEKRDWRGEVYFTVYGHIPAGTVTVCQ